MNTLTITNHCEARMSQRGIKKEDLDFLFSHSTDIGNNRIMLTKKDAIKVIENLKRQITKVERLTDKVIVVEGNDLITAYHNTTSIRFVHRKVRKYNTDRRFTRR